MSFLVRVLSPSLLNNGVTSLLGPTIPLSWLPSLLYNEVTSLLGPTIPLSWLPSLPNNGVTSLLGPTILLSWLPSLLDNRATSLQEKPSSQLAPSPIFLFPHHGTCSRYYKPPGLTLHMAGQNKEDKATSLQEKPSSQLAFLTPMGCALATSLQDKPSSQLARTYLHWTSSLQKSKRLNMDLFSNPPFRMRRHTDEVEQSVFRDTPSFIE